MARGTCTFKQRDVKAAVRAVVAAGCKVERVEVEKDGKIVVVAASTTPVDELDAELKQFEAEHEG
jgi:hypothetical protein